MPAPEEEDDRVTLSQQNALLGDLSLKLETEEDSCDLSGHSKEHAQFISSGQSEHNLTVTNFNNNVEDNCLQMQSENETLVMDTLVVDKGGEETLTKQELSYNVEEPMDEGEITGEAYFSEPCDDVEGTVITPVNETYLSNDEKHLGEEMILCKEADDRHDQDSEPLVEVSLKDEIVESITEDHVQECPTIFETHSENVELDYDEGEQVIETTETEVPHDCDNDSVAIHNIEETYADSFTRIITKPYTQKSKSIISKDGTLVELNQSNSSVKKIFPVGATVSKLSQSPLKRPLLPGPGQSKNVITKVIIQGNPSNSSTAGQTFKIIGGPAGSPLVSGQAKSLTLAQAQQMGIIAPGSKIQHILPSGSGQRRMILKKYIPTSSSNISSPTKILPAPGPSPVRGNIRPVTTFRGPVSVANVTTVRGVPMTTLKPMPSGAGVTQIRPVPVALSSIRPSVSNLVNIKPSSTVKGVTGPQKVIIRQGQIPIKGGTIISPSTSVPGQVIRIPPQSSNFQPIQIGGKQLQYVRFVSATGNPSATTLVSNPKVKVVRGPTVNLTSGSPGSTYKAIPIAPNPGTSMKTVLPKSGITPTSAKRILIPVTQGLSQIRLANNVSTPVSSPDSSITSPVSQLKTGQTGSPISVSSLQLKNLNTIPLTQIKQSVTSPVKVSGSTEILQEKSAVSNNQTLGEEENEVTISSEFIEHEPSEGDESEIQEREMESKCEEQMKTEPNEDENFDKENIDSDGRSSASPNRLLEAFEANGIRMKKPCNCTRSQCLKLYCECFANGEFCFQCNCNNCYNNIEHEEERQKSIKSCLDRNPSAFRPKIQIGDNEEDERRHNKGCHCKRSGCLKNYCECYEAKITCSKFCKCVSCRNTEEFLEGSRTGLIDPCDAVEDGLNAEQKPDVILRQSQSGNSIPKQPYNFISSEVIEATCQCLLAQAEEAVKNHLTREEGECMIIEEFGKCLVQIIGCSNLDENNF